MMNENELEITNNEGAIVGRIVFSPDYKSEPIKLDFSKLHGQKVIDLTQLQSLLKDIDENIEVLDALLKYGSVKWNFDEQQAHNASRYWRDHAERLQKALRKLLELKETT